MIRVKLINGKIQCNTLFTKIEPFGSSPMANPIRIPTIKIITPSSTSSSGIEKIILIDKSVHSAIVVNFL